MAKRAAFAAVLVAALWTAGAWLFGPYYVERAMSRYEASEPERRAQAARVVVNPLNLAVTLHDLDVARPGAAVTAGRAVVNFGFSTVLRREIVLDALVLEQARVSIARPPDAAPGAGIDAWSRAVARAVPDAAIGRLDVADSRLRLADAPGAPYRLLADGIDLSAVDLMSRGDDVRVGAYAVEFAETGGIALQASGEASLSPLSSSGRFALEGLALARAAQWFGGGAGTPPRGALQIGGGYALTGGAGNRLLTLSGGETIVRDASARLPDAGAVAAGRVDAAFDAEIDLSGGRAALTARLDLNAQAVAIDERTAAVPTDIRFDALTAAGTAALGDGGARFEGRVEAAGATLADTSGRELLAADRMTASGVAAGLAASTVAAMPRASIDAQTVRIDAPRTRIELAPAEEPRLPQWVTAAVDPFAPRSRDSGETRAPWALGARRIEFAEGRFELADDAASPPVLIRIEQAGGTVSGLGAEATALIDIEGLVAPSGSAEIAGRVRRAGAEAFSEFEIGLENLDAALFSPYAARLAGWRLEGGTIGVDLDYRVRYGRLVGSSNLVLEGLELARAAAPAEGALPLALAAALYTDRGGRIDLAVPLAANVAGPTAHVPAVLGDALEQLVADAARAPFVVLGALVERDGSELQRVPFAPGSAEVPPAAEPRLAALADALNLRPALGLVLDAGYAPAADAAALAREQVRLHVVLATAGPAQAGADTAIDFASPRVQSVIDEFAAERLAAGERERLAEQFDIGGATDAAQRAPYYEALFAALAANETIAESALRRLGRYRAQALADALDGFGVAPERVRSSEAPAGSAEIGDTGQVMVALGLRARMDYETPQED